MASVFSLIVQSRRLLIGGALLGVCVWVLLLDSHSVVDRVRWHQEHAALSAENERLQAEIDTLRDRLERPLSDELVEQMAREEYGMQRAGETVYPLTTPNP